jgi:hypothetical protein
MPSECQFFKQLGAPESFYVEYRFREGVWQRIPLSDFSVGHVSNLLLTVRPTEETGHVSLEQKKARNGVPSVDSLARGIHLGGSNPCSGRPMK